MNLNDLRANAYKNMGNQNTENTSDSKSQDSNKNVIENSQKNLNQNNLQKNNTNQNSNQNENQKNFTPLPLFKNVNKKINEIFDNSKKLSSQLNKNSVLPKNNDSKTNFEQNNSLQKQNTQKDSKNSIQSLYKVPKKDDFQNKQDKIQDSSYRKVAKFLVLIGVDQAAKILEQLSQEEIEKILPEIATIRTISDEEANEILQEFQGLYKNVSEKGGKETARAILEKAYGKEKANELIEKTANFHGNKPFEYLNDAKPEKIKLLLNGESIAVKTLVISNIEPKIAAQTLNLLEKQEKTEIVQRLAKLQAVSPEILAKIDQTIFEKSKNIQNDNSENLDGKNALAQILKQMKPQAENELLKTLQNEDPELCEDLKNRLFTEDDVINADEKFIAQELRQMQNLEIVQLIAQKKPEFTQKILSCVSTNRKSEILTDQKIHSPLRKSDCQEITSKFLNKLRIAFEEGKLLITGRNDDIYV